MRLFKRILGFFIAGSFVLAILVFTILETIRDPKYLVALLAAYVLSAIFLFGIYLILKSYNKI